MSLDAYLDRYRASGEQRAFVALATTASTNRLALNVARRYLANGQGPPPLIAVAAGQSAGRGRRGRRWASPAGEGIYTSLLLSAGGAEELTLLPLRAAVALCEALDPVLGTRCGIKWPNDLIVGGRKLGGVLIEALGGPRAVVVGYGINVLQEEGGLPAAGATSIRLVSGAAPELPRLTVDLAVAVAARLAAREERAAAVAAYAGRSVHRPGDELRCRVADEEIAGRFAGFDDRGRLRLETADGERRLSAADVLEVGAGEVARG